MAVNEVTKGDIKKDFTFFSLDDKLKKATPYYVRLNVVNEGPSGLGGVAIPILAHTKSNTVFPPNELVGTFKPCPNPALPESFLKGSKADLCLVFLLPKGEKLQHDRPADRQGSRRHPLEALTPDSARILEPRSPGGLHSGRPGPRWATPTER